jgi:hypothetical protein
MTNVKKLPVLVACFVTVLQRPIETKRNEVGPKLKVILQAGILITEPQPLLLPFNHYIIAVPYFLLPDRVGM